MNRLLVPVAVLAAVLLSATCSMGTPADPADETPADETSMDETSMEQMPDEMTTERTTEEARYRVTFASDWTAATHSTNFPGSPHFSPLVGATHDESMPIWQLGELASDGMESMAETGGTSNLGVEIAALIAAGTAHGKLDGGGLGRPPASVSLEFDVVPEHPYVTLVSMLAPSPDWFVGVSGLSLLADDGTWKEREEVSLLLYDAGTDDGARFTSGNADSDPAQPISRLTSDPRDTDFTDGAPAVGTFLFEKLP